MGPELAASIESEHDEERQESRSIYFPALDTLRGFFAASVVTFHFLLMHLWHVPDETKNAQFNRWGFGAFGVPFFFVLSSFLITNLLLEEREKTGRISIAPFYMRRILRVWPVYFAALLVGQFVIVRLAHVEGTSIWLVPFLLFFANFGMSGLQMGAPPMAYAALWSVSVEEQFYAVWPWLIRLTSRKALPWAGVALILAAILVRDWRYELVGQIHA